MSWTRANTPIFELVRGAEGYPERLAALDAPPLVLRCLGRVSPSAPHVAIVGTRRADADGLAFARTLARELAQRGHVVVSGGALGIDTAAHEGALEAGGSTLAILPAGLSPPYPRGNERLFERIVVEGGALMSEMPDGSDARAHRLLRRNELVAAISDAVVVVQAPRRSGALSTAAHARACARPVFVMPSSPWDERGIGGLELLRRGARVCLEASDVLSVTAPEGGNGPHPGALVRNAPESPRDLDGDEGQVLGALGRRPLHPDEIARLTGLPVDRVQRALLGLLLDGRVDDRDGGRYVTAPRMR